MLNVEQAKSTLQKAFPDRVIHWAVEHEGYWYLCAIDPTDLDEGDLNPYFKVHASSGLISEFYVVNDIPLFQTIVAQARASLA